MTKLIAVMMRVPNDQGVYTPSKNLKPIEVPNLSKYVHTAKTMLISFDPDGISNPQETVTYLIDTNTIGENGTSRSWPVRYCRTSTGFFVKNWPVREKVER